MALTGANGAYGRTFLAQLPLTPEIVPAILVDPDVDGVLQLLAELGLPSENAIVCSDMDETKRTVAEGGIALVAGIEAIHWGSLDVLVEACGLISHGTRYARDAIANDVHVVMVSKEVDSVAGAALFARAAERGVSYLPGDGDQPANLLRLLEWVSAVGLDVVAIGKSSEYDLEFDPATGTVTQAGETISAPALGDLLELGDDASATLARRAEAVAALKRHAAANSCEMSVVAQRTGIIADVEAMHYPVARIDELADIYAARADGGILEHDGVVDVFSALRLPGEASFAGGVFAIVRTGDPVSWTLLAEKGHVVSRDGAYACLYWPYHYMGVETPLTVQAAMDRAPARAPKPSVVLAARAVEDLSQGTVFAVHGHHHEIDGVSPVIVAGDPEVSAYYLLDGARLVRPVARGELIGAADIERADPVAAELYAAGYRGMGEGS